MKNILKIVESKNPKIENKNLLNINEFLGYKLKRTQHILRLHMDEALRPLNLTSPQYSVLSQLELRPGISNAALARASFITAQTMNPILLNLQKNDFIERAYDPKYDKRVLSTQLTPKGQKVLEQAHQLIKEIENHMISTISKEQAEIFNSVLIECFNNLNSKRSTI